MWSPDFSNFNACASWVYHRYYTTWMWNTSIPMLFTRSQCIYGTVKLQYHSGIFSSGWNWRDYYYEMQNIFNSVPRPVHLPSYCWVMLLWSGSTHGRGHYLPVRMIYIILLLKQEHATYDMIMCSTPVTIQAIIWYIICY